MVAVAVMFSFRAMRPLPTEQDINSESDLLAFSIAVKRGKCCNNPNDASFILHTAAHRVSSVERPKSECDVIQDMSDVLQEKSGRAHMLSRKCGEYLKEFPELAPVKTLKQFHELLAQGGFLQSDEPLFLYTLALATGMHITIFYKFTVWTTRAISGEIGCSLHFAKMPSGHWVELKDAEPGALSVRHDKAEDVGAMPNMMKEMEKAETESVGMTQRVEQPCTTVVKSERVESRASLVDDLFAAYELTFPPSDDNAELEMKEVMCDRRLLVQPVVLVERMCDSTRKKDLQEAAAEASDANAALVPLTCATGRDKSVDKCAVNTDVKSRRDRKVRGVVTRSRAKSKTGKTGDTAGVCVSNIVPQARRVSKQPIVTRSCSRSRLCPSVKRSDGMYKHRSLHPVHCMYCDFCVMRSMRTRTICMSNTLCMSVNSHCVQAIGSRKGHVQRMKSYIVRPSLGAKNVVGTQVERWSTTGMF